MKSPVPPEHVRRGEREQDEATLPNILFICRAPQNAKISQALHPQDTHGYGHSFTYTHSHGKHYIEIFLINNRYINISMSMFFFYLCFYQILYRPDRRDAFSRLIIALRLENIVKFNLLFLLLCYNRQNLSQQNFDSNCDLSWTPAASECPCLL